VAAASDGKLWELWFTAVPEPGQMGKYIETAQEGQRAGHMLPWIVREMTNGSVVGSTRYHDIVAPIDRVEIGYTWYAKSWQRSHVNTTCKLLLCQHAFESLGCKVVGWRTDNFNFRSQRAIEALGAKKDGVLRHHQARKDGTVRDTVMYSMLANGRMPNATCSCALLATRQSKRHRGALGRLAGCADLATMSDHEMFCDGEP
jgi:RimJ/RimL family protein N-acetyltransferase